MSQRNKGINTFHHIIMRGSRDMEIVKNNRDRYDFLKLLYYLNDEYHNLQWERDLKGAKCKLFERPDHWPERKPLVHIEGFCLLDNHFHILIKEIKEGGISDFMRRLPNAMTRRYNKNYGGKGTIFQGSYRARTVENDADLMNVALYVLAKNTMERYKGGIKGALKDFEKAHTWACQDEFSSYADYGSTRNSVIIEKDIIAGFYKTPAFFKKEAQKYLEHWQERKEELGHLSLE